MSLPRPERITILGGCGHVGLPLGIVLAEVGYTTSLFDLNQGLVDKVNSAVMPHLEEEGPERLKKVIDAKRLTATVSPEGMADSSVIIVTVGTPVDEYMNPRVQALISAVDQVKTFLHSPDQLVIFRSTLAPGVLQTVADFLHSQGCPVAIAYCPERIVQGKALTELKGLPQLISGLSPEAIERCREIFLATTDKEPIVLKPMEAELAKLFCNAWRYITFAVSNQFYQIAENAGVSFSRVHEAVVMDYPRMKDFAKAGLTAGPCLLKDTMQLAAFSQNTFFLGHSAMLINEGLPAFLINQLTKEAGGSLRDKTVGLLGLAFKPDNDDTRESLSFKLRKLMVLRGARVLCHDPFLEPQQFPNLEFADLETVLAADAIVIGVPHTAYRHLIFSSEQILVDVWGAFPRPEGAQ